MFNTYISERIIVAYAMRLPPALDNRLTNYSVSLLKWAALLLLINGFWMIGSTQIFGEEVWSYVDLKSDIMKSGHHFLWFRSYTAPVTFVIFANIIMIILDMVIGDWLERVGFSLQNKEIEVDEDLPNVFETLTTAAAQTFIQSNAYMQGTYGFEF